MRTTKTWKSCPLCGEQSFVGPRSSGYCSLECTIASNVRVTPTGCWEWQGLVDRFGYGRIGRGELAHRVTYRVVFGIEPGELQVRHRCDNPPCVNWNHLDLGTHQDNMDDCVARGRRPRGEDAARAVLAEPDVLAIRASPLPTIELAALYGVSQTSIQRVIARTSWKHV